MQTYITPEFTPAEAYEACHKQDPTVKNGWHYYLDGPMLCPLEVMAPVAYHESQPHVRYYVMGEVGEEITSTTRWIVCID